MSDFRQRRRAEVLARYARLAAKATGGCATRWQRLKREFARDLSPGMRLERKILLSLGLAGEDAVAEEGLELHEAIGRILSAERDSRGHLAAIAMLLEELVAFERHEMAAALGRCVSRVNGIVAQPAVTASGRRRRASA